MKTYYVYMQPGQGFARVQASEVRENDGGTLTLFDDKGAEVAHFHTYTSWIDAADLK